MTPAEYQETLDAIGDPQTPLKFKGPLMQRIKDYESQQTKNHPSASHLEEQGSMLGPELKQTPLEEAIPPREAPPMAEADKQLADNAYNLGGPARPGEPPLPSAGEELGNAAGMRATHEKWFQSLKDPSLVSASKMRDLYKPPSYIHKPPPNPGAGPIDRAGQALANARATLPAEVGGNALRYHEPPIQQFQRDMFPVFGDRVYQMGPDSEQYKQYSDLDYKHHYEDAQQKGHSIIRHSFATGEGNDPAQKMRGEQLDEFNAFMGSAPFVGKLGARIAGGDEGVRRLEGSIERHPLESTLGELYTGAKAIPELPPAATGAGRLATAAGTGAAFAGGATAADQALGSPSTTDRSKVEEILKAGGMGAGAGLGFGLAGEGARALRPDTPQLRAARGAGADTSVLRGMKPGPDIARVESEVKGLGLDPREAAVPHEIEKARPAVTRQVETESAKAAFEHGTARNQTEEALSKHFQPAQDLFDTVHKAHAEQFSTSGAPLTDTEERALRSIKQKVSQVTPQDTRRELVKVIAPHEDPIVERTKIEYGPDAPEQIKKAYYEQKGKKFDENAQPLAATKPQEEATNPGGRPKTLVSGEADTHPASNDTIPDKGQNLDTLSQSEDEDVADNAGTYASPLNAAKYGLKRVQSKGAGKAVIKTPEGNIMRRLPEVTDAITAKEARRLGIPVDPGVADENVVIVRKTMDAPRGEAGGPSAAKSMTGGEARKAGYDVPNGVGEHDLVYVEPKRLNPAELRVVEQHLHTLQEAGKVPHINEIERAVKRVRDSYPEAGPAVGARATIEDLATGNKTELKGLSALQHNESVDMSARARTRQRVGLPTSENQDPVKTFRNATMAKGESPGEIADRKAAWERAGKGDAYKFIEGLKAYQELAGKHINPMTAVKVAGGHVPYHVGNLQALGLHLDPILAGRYLPSAGRLGGAVAKPSLEYVNKLLNPHEGL